jgi:hypothetical protein
MRRTGKTGTAALGLLSAAACCTSGASSFAESVSVGDDLIVETVASPSYDNEHPTGIRAGNFFISPRAEALATYDDNIFARSNDRQSDYRFELRPSVEVRSSLPRHRLDFSLDGRIVDFAEHTDQNYQNFQARLRSAMHFDHAHTISFSALSALDHAEVSEFASSSTAAEPIPFFHNRLSTGLTRDAGRLFGTLSAAYESWDYSDVQAADGTTVNEDLRDLSQYSAQIRAGYRFSPGYEIIGKARTIRQTGMTNGELDATGYEALGGLAFETSPVMHWSLLAGYGFRNYDDGSREDTSSSLLEAELSWQPTQRMTVLGTLSRKIIDTLDDEGESRIDNSIRARVTYEIWHNLLGYVEAKYTDAAYIGSDQEDQTWNAIAGLSYKLNDNWALNLNYDYKIRESSDDEFDMDRNRITVGARVKF